MDAFCYLAYHSELLQQKTMLICLILIYSRERNTFVLGLQDFP